LVPAELPEIHLSWNKQAFHVDVKSKDFQEILKELQSKARANRCFSLAEDLKVRAMRVEKVFENFEKLPSVEIPETLENSENSESSAIGNARRIATRRATADFMQEHDLAGDLSPEVAAAISGLMQPHIRKEISARISNLDKREFKNSEIRCYAVAYTLKEVLEECKDSILEDEWVEGLDRELRTLIQRGVLRLIPWQDVGPEHEILPSLCVWTRKSPEKEGERGRAKCRITACGNFAISNDDDPTQNYSETVQMLTASSVMRWCLINGFFVGLRDVSEAFTQSEQCEKAADGLKRVLRPPSALRHLWCRILVENGYSPADYHKVALAVDASIYGEADAPKVWGATFGSWLCDRNQESTMNQLEDMGFTELKTDSRLYVKLVEGTFPVFVLVYVDDVICCAQRSRDAQQFFDALEKRFKCTGTSWINGPHGRHTDLANECPVFLTDQYYFEQSDDGVPFCCVSQSSWITGAFERLRVKLGLGPDFPEREVRTLNPKLFDIDWLSEPIDSNPPLSKDELTMLRAGVNTISYLSAHTRPDLASALGTLARGQTVKGRRRFLESLKLLLSYAWFHRSRKLKFACSPVPVDLSATRVCVCCDADSSMGGMTVESCHARHGYVLSLKSLVGKHWLSVTTSWKTGLQSTLSVSSTEAEIVCASFATRSLLPLVNVLQEIRDIFKMKGLSFAVETPILYQDNEAALSCAAGGQMRRLRHLSLHQLYVRFVARDGLLRVLPKRTHLMQGDIMSKVLEEQVVQRLLPLMGIFG
jgi:hypothetical protein